MSNPRTEISDLLLQNSPNLARALRREKDDASVTLTPEQQSEVEQLDELIAAAMRACKKGSTVGGKRNPAFANLQALVRTRDMLLKGRRATAKSSKDLLAEADRLLGRGN
ncbi:MAG TPA: hypothetical protein VEJ46_14040 [Candidatus Acidoferrum sp.]|nr:hypothetical protein [Candidatus Acidoferrum sp.]